MPFLSYLSLRGCSPFVGKPDPSALESRRLALTKGETMIINPSFPLDDIFQLIFLIGKMKEEYIYRPANYYTATIHELKPGFDRSGTNDFGNLFYDKTFVYFFYLFVNSCNVIASNTIPSYGLA
ncbi:MAG: hypothetical protein ABI472_23020 [Ginsengibacter sp.]